MNHLPTSTTLFAANRLQDKNGYEFIMMKEMKSLARDLVQSVKGSFEEMREFSLRDYRVNGITVKHQMYPSDEKERYFRIYYNERKQTSERENVEEKIDRICNLSPDVKREFKKLYIAYKLDTNFVDIVVQKQRLRISLNMKFSEIHDPRGCARTSPILADGAMAMLRCSLNIRQRLTTLWN